MGNPRDLDDMYLDVDREQIKKALLMMVNEILNVSPHRHITEKAIKLAVGDINNIYNPEINIDDYMVK